jgi:hypothetical protein
LKDKKDCHGDDEGKECRAGQDIPIPTQWVDQIGDLHCQKGLANVEIPPISHNWSQVYVKT